MSLFRKLFRPSWPAFVLSALVASSLSFVNWPTAAARASAPPAAPQQGLAGALNPDGTLRPGLQGGFDTRAYRMELTAAGAPRFVAASTSATSCNGWDTQFSAANGVNGPVYALAVNGTELYVGGGFTTAGNLTANRVAKFDTATGAWSKLGTNGNGVSDTVYALALNGSDLYVGGSFTSANVGGAAVAVNRVAKVNTATGVWSKLGAGAGNGVSGTVNALLFHNSALYVGGTFGQANVGAAVTTNNVAKHDPATGVWSKLGTDGNGVNSVVFALAASGNDLYVGGAFTSANVTGTAVSANYVAKVDTATGAWSKLGATGNGVGALVRALAFAGSELFAGGDFTSANQGGAPISANRLAKFVPASGVWSALGTGGGNGVDNSVYALLSLGGELYVGGAFTTANVSGTTVSANYVARVNPATGAWGVLGTNGFNSAVYALASAGGAVYLGGNFTTASTGGATVSVSYLAKFDPAAPGFSAPWGGASPNNVVYALAVSGTDLYVGGSFTAVGATAANYVAKFNTLTNTWSTLGTGGGNGVNNTVYALALDGATLYAGGAFTSANSGGPAVTVNYVARYDTVTGAWSKLGTGSGSGVSSYVYALAVGASDLYVGGEFTLANQGGTTVAANRIARVNKSTGAWSKLGTGAGSGVDNSVNALALSGADLYVGGAFTITNVGGTTVAANRLAKVDTATGAWSKLGATGNGVNNVVNALVMHGGVLYAGGVFTVANVGANIAASYVAKYDPATGAWSKLGTAASLGVDNIVNELAVGGGDLYVGGAFTNVSIYGASFSASRSAKLNLTTGVWSPLGQSGDGLIGPVTALATDGSNVYLGGNFTTAITGGAVVATGYLAKYGPTATGTLSAPGPLSGNRLNGQVLALAVSGTDVYVGGDFTLAGNVSVNRLAKFNTLTNTWSALGTGGGNGVDATVRALACDSSTLYVGGAFNTANVGGTTVSVNKITAYNLFTGAWTPLGTFGGNGVSHPTSAQVNALALTSNALYVGGSFTTANAGGAPSVSVNNVALYSLVSGWLALGTSGGSGVNGIVWALAANASNVYVGGNFTTANEGGTTTVSANYVARYNFSTGWSALGATGNGVDNRVQALALDGNDLFVGGFFTNANVGAAQLAANYVAKFNTANGAWSALGAGGGNGVSFWVFALRVNGNDVYAGGLFDTANVGGTTVAANNVAKLNKTTGAWSALTDPGGGNGVNNYVFALALTGCDLYAGGQFTVAGDNKSSQYLARFCSANSPPVITAQTGLTRPATAAASNSPIAVVSDAETPAGSLSLNLYPGSVVNGVSLSSIVNTNGVITANIATSGAATANFILLINDGLATAATVLTVTVSNECYTVANSGNWNAPATWGCGGVPGAGAAAIVQSGQQVTLNANPAALASLTIQSGGTLALDANRTLAGNLTLNNQGTLALNGFDLSTGGFTLTLTGPNCPTGSGDITGSTRRDTLATGTTYCFSHADNTVNFASATFSAPSLTVNLSKGGGVSGATARVYTITPSGISAFSATLRLRYLDSELNGLVESGLRLYRYNGSTWEDWGGTHDAGNNHVTASGITGFSPWVIGGPSAPTAVTLAEFSAAAQARGGVTLTWRTGYEADCLGFNVYREMDGQRVKLTPALVAGSALLAAGRTTLSAGNGYHWLDARGAAGTGYWLEEIDLRGARQWFGPVYATANLVESAAATAPLLHELNATAEAPAREWLTEEAVPEARPLHSPAAQAPAAQAPAAHSPAAHSPAAQAPAAQAPAAQAPAAQAPAAQAADWTLPNQDALKLSVNQTGWYRVSAAELQAAGFSPNVNPLLVQLYADGVEVPIRAYGKGHTLEALEFYGQALDTPATDTRVYWLTAGPGVGARWRVEANNPPDKANTTSYRATVERRERLIYFSGLLNGDADNWFGPVVTNAGVAQTLTARFIDAAATATLEITLQGVTEQAHAVNVELNGQYLGTANFSGKQWQRAQFQFDATRLRDGANEVRCLSTAGASDINLLDTLRLHYARGFVAERDTLRFRLEAGQSAWLSGFSTDNLRLLELNDNGTPARELTVKPQATPDGFGFAVQSAAGAAYLALTEAELARVAELKPNTRSNWRAKTNAADFVIVTHRAFLNAANRLAQARRAQELRTVVVDVEDAYDEFSFGAKSPQAVKDLLTTARANWLVKPRFALFIGDATYDPRNYLGQGDYDFLPTKLGATYYFETALDNWFADANDDGMPELALGRLPVRTAAQAEAVVAKLLAFKPDPQTRSALLVSDRTTEGVNFAQQSQQYAALLPALMVKQFVNRQDGAPEQVRAQIINTLNQNNPLLVNWAGHGSTQVWTGDGLLRTQDAPALTNRAPGLFVMATCLNGFFTDTQLTSLGEAVLLDTPGGAFAVVASTALNVPAPQHTFNLTLYQRLFGAPGLTLGEAMMAARLAAQERDVRNSYVLFGDPTLRLR